MTVNNIISHAAYQGLQVEKIAEIQAEEILFISLEKSTVFPKHTSPTDAHLIMLEGTIAFNIKGTEYVLKKGTFFDFPKEEPHWVKALENSKFLIIR